MSGAVMDVPNAAILATLPDGSVISWLRILGDETSEAVAILRVETEYRSAATDAVEPRTVWVSPGGWDPQTIESAGVTFPARVLRFGPALVVTTDMVGSPQWQPGPFAFAEADLPQSYPLLTGGTWGRTEALAAAATVHQGQGPRATGDVLEMAEAYEAWLQRDTLAEVLADGARADLEPELVPPPGFYGPVYDAVTADKLRQADELSLAVGILKECRDQYALKLPAAHLSRMTSLAQALRADADRRTP